MFGSKFTCVCYTVAKVRLKLFENEARKMHVSCHLHWISMFPLKDQIFCGPSICFAIKLFLVNLYYSLLFQLKRETTSIRYSLFVRSTVDRIFFLISYTSKTSRSSRVLYLHVALLTDVPVAD